jgi:hypothetical protein
MKHEELIAEEAKLGVRKPTRVRPVAGDTTHTTRSSVSRKRRFRSPLSSARASSIAFL